ncbi:MAG: hypothetical protein ACKVTZ_14095 [Bacteroidia bacterium]
MECNSQNHFLKGRGKNAVLHGQLKQPDNLQKLRFCASAVAKAAATGFSKHG